MTTPASARFLGSVVLAGMLAGVAAFLTVRWIWPGPQAAGPSVPPGRAAAPGVGFETLKGRWARPDGYVIEIRDVNASGTLDASYLNPRPINVAEAQAATRDGTLRLFLELRDTGYPGCTYTLTYDARTDRLAGVYYQAAAQERYAVEFARMKQDETRGPANP